MNLKQALAAACFSFYSPAIYCIAAREWKGLGLRYLLLITLLTLLPVYFSIVMGFRHFLLTEGDYLIDQLPEITIMDGAARINKPEPYQIYTSDNQLFAIIDTTGGTQSLQDSTALLLLTRDAMQVREREAGIQIYSLAEVKEFFMDSEAARQWMQESVPWLLWLMLPFALGGMFLIRAVQGLLYSLFGIVFGGILKVDLDFPAILRLTALAMTPALAADMVLGLTLGSSGLVPSLLVLGYLYFGVKANRGSLPQIPDEAI